MDENVIRPLGLAHTHADRKDTPDPDCTQFYENGADGKFVVAPVVDNSYKWAGGGYLSTPEDLVRFGSALLHPGFLQQKSLNLLFTSQKTSAGKLTGYGMGWFIRKDADGHMVFLHTGGSIGGTSFLLLHPYTATVVAFVCNDTTAPFGKKDEDSIVELFTPCVVSAAPLK